MAELPATRYAKTHDGLNIAYQVVGDGPRDLIFIPWWWSHIEAQWDDPSISAFLERLASFSRLILFDQRGIGLSDPVPLDRLPRLEEWTDDVETVLDAVGSERAAVVGHGDGGLVATFFAASRPKRTASLVLIDAYARLAAADGYEGVEQETLDNLMRSFEDVWGKGEMVGLIAPSRWTDAAFRDRLGQHLPNATYVEVPGADHLYWVGDTEATLAQVEEFLTGAPVAPHADRVLAHGPIHRHRGVHRRPGRRW